MVNPILDQSSVEVEDDFQLNKQIVFNQFMGLLSETKPIQYSVEVYDDTGIIKTFGLSSALKNNIPLVFIGKLLDDVVYGVGFQITKNENWDNENEIAFRFIVIDFQIEENAFLQIPLFLFQQLVINCEFTT